MLNHGFRFQFTWFRSKGYGFVSYLVNLDKSEDLITLIQSYLDDDRMVNALRCVEGDFVKYYGVYCYSKPLKFMMHLLKSLFQDNQYDLSQIGENRQGSVGYVYTTDYLFADNLRPVIDQLSNYDVLSTKIFIIVRITIIIIIIIMIITPITTMVII